MFAHNNDEIDYFRLAVVNAKLIQKNLGLGNDQITIVTDQHSKDHGIKTMGKRVVNSASKNIVVVEKDVKFKHSNKRLYKDTSQTGKHLSFYNINRCDVYEISPYDETILIDADYLIFSDALNRCWGHNNELMMNWQYQDIMHEREFHGLERLSSTGITMYWATVVYFRKSSYCEYFFDLVKHVRQNQDYYRDLYKWPGNLYRNDYSFSIAAHTLGGFQDCVIPQLPVTLYKTFDTDDVHSFVPSKHGGLRLYLEKIRSPGDFVLCRWHDVDIHVMNKWAINRISDSLFDFVSNKSKPHHKQSVGKKKRSKKQPAKSTTTRQRRATAA